MCAQGTLFGGVCGGECYAEGFRGLGLRKEGEIYWRRWVCRTVELCGCLLLLLEAIVTSSEKWSQL